MTVTWTTIAPGIRCRDHEPRKHGVKADRYFTLRLYVDGKRIEEALGWASDGWTLAKAQAKLSALREAKRTGEGETTLREKRAVAGAKKAAETKRQEEEERRNVTLETYWTNTYEPWGRATKPKAMRQEGCQWRMWIKPTLGDVRVADIGMSQWDFLVKTVSAAGKSERTREYVAGTLRRILKHAHERGVVDVPPSAKRVGATAPKNNRRTRTISDEELQAVLDELKGRDIRAWRVTLFAAATGCRASEAFRLRWTDLDLNAKTAVFPKTKNSDARVVPLADELVTALADLPAGKPTSPVFTNEAGGAYREAPAAFRAAVDALQLNEEREPRDRLVFHSLRHLAATRLAKVLPLRALMDVMGWKVPAMALRYSHTRQEDLETAARALGAALKPASPAGKVVASTGRKRGDV